MGKISDVPAIDVYFFLMQVSVDIAVDIRSTIPITAIKRLAAPKKNV